MIFVTGGTGLLGNNIVRELCRQGQPVRALCRSGTPTSAFDGLDVEIVTGDLSDANLLQSSIEGCRAVIHSAAMIHIGWTRLEPSRQVNVAGTERIVDACLANQARLVHVSTVDTLPAAMDREHPVSESTQGGVPKVPCNYVLSKRESEQVVSAAITERTLDGVIVHPGFMLGPYDWKPSSGRMMLEVNRAPILAAPPGGCSLCDARDVAAAIVRAVDAERSGEHYILAGDNLTYQELWTEMLQVTGRRRRVQKMGGLVQRVGPLLDAGIRWLRLREGDVNGAAIAMGSQNHFYDSSKATAELQYTRRARRETMEDAWRWLSKQSS